MGLIVNLLGRTRLLQYNERLSYCIKCFRHIQETIQLNVSRGNTDGLKKS